MAGEEGGLMDSLKGAGQTLSPFGTMFSIGAGIFGMVESNKNWSAVNRKLDEIQESLKVIQQRIDNLYAETLMAELITELTPPETKIRDSFRRLMAVKEDFKANRAKFYAEWGTKNHRDIERLVDDILDPTQGIPFHLHNLSDVIGGTGSFRSLMEAVIAKIKFGGGAPDRAASKQSQYFDAVKYYEKWLLIQQKAIICLGSAYLYKDPDYKGASAIIEEDITNWDSLYARFKTSRSNDPSATYLFGLLTWTEQQLIYNNHPQTGASQVPRAVTIAFNKAINGPLVYGPGRLQAGVGLSARTQYLVDHAAANMDALELKRLNRTILSEAFNEIPRRPTLAEAVAYVSGIINDPGASVSKLQQQANSNKTSVNLLNQWHQDKQWGTEGGKDFLMFGKNIYTWDTNEVMADDDKVVIGLRFVGQGPRMALEICQGTFSAGKVAQTGDTWKGAIHGADPNFFAVIQRSHNGEHIEGHTDDHYVDMCEVSVPDGRVVVGAALYQKGNRVAIKLAAAALNSQGNVDRTTTTWYKNDRYVNRDPEDFVQLRIWVATSNGRYDYGSFRGVSVRDLRPDPPAPISGAKLCCYGLNDGHSTNRVVLAVRPGLFNTGDLWKRAEVLNIEDVWRKYDVAATALATVLIGESTTATTQIRA